MSPIIFIAFLFAPTVPSPPFPQKIQRVVCPSEITKLLSTSRDVLVTSSIIPTVKWFFGSSLAKLSNTDFIWAGLVSFCPSPYLPAIIFGFLSESEKDSNTSKYRGSPAEPFSFVLSKTAILSTVFGIASSKCLVEMYFYKSNFSSFFI